MKDLKKIAEERGLINETIRSFFCDRGFIEVETPLLVESPGMEPNLSPFETTMRSPDRDQMKAGLITSPEYSMKKLLGQGMEKIFTLTKVFRNYENLGGEHNPEFTMLEWYAQGEGYEKCMQETRDLIAEVFRVMKQNLPTEKSARLDELFRQHVGIDLYKSGKKELQEACFNHKIHTDETDTPSDLFFRLVLAKIEPNFKNGLWTIYGYPKYQAALARIDESNMFGERFEMYIDGVEICNGFTELTDAAEQRKRFESEKEEREEQGKTLFPIDEELLRVLGSIQNPTYGNALGVDRLHMLSTGKASIDEVLLFPASNLFRNEYVITKRDKERNDH